MHSACFGIYEKALPALRGWSEKMDAAAAAGFDFVEMSVDDDKRRLNRLDWSSDQRASMREASANSGVRLQTVILSAHRRFPLGSHTPAIREYAVDLLNRAVELAVDVGARIVQLSGYYVFYEKREAASRHRFLENLQRGLERASQAGVMLGIETMDGEDVTSVEEAMRIVTEVKSPWLQVYPDVGNLAANGLDVVAELRRGAGHLVGIHLKDTRPGEYRRVPFGEGIVPFGEIFQTLDEIGYDGGYLVEMWNDDEPDAMNIIASARRWLGHRMNDASVEHANAI